jgi:glyoxylase-like metal-dependent hydrolase (beta-lactamase superfamily II)
MLASMVVALLTAAPAVNGYTASEAAFATNAWWVETKDGLVLIDSAFTVSEGKKLKAALEATKRPLLAVLLTHAHPDHANGIGVVLGEAEVPVVALASVEKSLRALDGPKRAYWGPQLKEDYPATTRFPDTLLKDGESVTFGGVTFTAHDLGAGESDVEAVWTTGDAAFVGDLVMNRVHPWLAEGHSAQWLTSLARAKALLSPGAKRLFPGHGAKGGLELLAWQRSYLEAYRAAVKALAGADGALTAEAKKQLEQKMERVLPKAPLAGLVAMSADAVAAELKAAR